MAFQLRIPPTASDDQRLNINASHEGVYEAALWVRARTRAPAGARSMSRFSGNLLGASNPPVAPASKLPAADLAYELLYPEQIVFQTFFPPGVSGSTAPEAAPGRRPGDEVEPPRQLSFTDASHTAATLSSYPPFSVNWHLDGPRRVTDVPSRNVRLLHHADGFDQAYVQGQPVEVFFSSNPRGDRDEAGVWCLGVVRENAAFDSTTIAVHVFGSVNEHALHTSSGEAIVGPNSFGYNLVIPRYPHVTQPRVAQHDDAYLHGNTEPAAPLLGGRLPIRSLRYIGNNADGSMCRYGSREAALAAQQAAAAPDVPLNVADASTFQEPVAQYVPYCLQRVGAWLVTVFLTVSVSVPVPAPVLCLPLPCVTGCAGCWPHGGRVF